MRAPPPPRATLLAVATSKAPIVYSAEVVPLDELRPHPENYRAHPDDQRRHLVGSIRRHGLYRNVVVARDSTILAGHGVVEAVREIGLAEIPVVRLDLAPDDPEALAVLTGDNEVARLALVDDRHLAALLRRVRETSPEHLLGTGFNAEGLDDELARLLREVSAPDEFGVLDPDTLQTEHRCPSCGYEWSGDPAPGSG